MSNETLFRTLERWMIQNPESARELSVSTRDRYLRGGIPAPLLWFLRNTGALEALAKDARKLTSAELEEIQAQVEARSTKQRKYRGERGEAGMEVDEAPPSRRRKMA